MADVEVDRNLDLHSNSTFVFASGVFVTDSMWNVPYDNFSDMELTTDNVTTQAHYLIPKELTFTMDNLVSVIAYTVLFTIAACGNLLVFVTLFRNRHRKSRVNLFIMHLSIADMIVTFVMIPMEIGWHVTVAWRAGDVACRLLMFFRAFGFYLSSFILITISLDRFFAITQPMSLSKASKRARSMLVIAWLFSAVASLPQVSKASKRACSMLVIAWLFSAVASLPQVSTITKSGTWLPV